MAAEFTDDDRTPAPERGGLRSLSFLGLLATQLLGAANDNAFRLLVIGIYRNKWPEYSSVVLAAGLVCFTLPYLLLAAPAGYLADRFSKRTVIVACKMAEIVIMAAGVAAIYWGEVVWVFVVLAMMGAQSALFGPSKFGSIPEMLRSDRISAANGVMGLVTILATVAGVVIGNLLYDAAHLWIAAAVLLGLASLGTLVSLTIAHLPPANPLRRFPFDAVRQTIRDLSTLASNRPMLRVALGIAFFWSMGALAQSNILEFGTEGGMQQSETNPLLAALVVGVGLGSVLAGVWSAGKVELGILPLGAAGMTIGAVALFSVSGDLVNSQSAWTVGKTWACVWLFMLGSSAGLFNVPLESYMQHNSPHKTRGSILAASNFISFTGILLTALLYYFLRAPVDDGTTLAPRFTARQVFLLAGALTFPILIYIVWLIPGASIRFVVWLASKTVYRIRIHGQENIPNQGALLVANHVSWLDGVLLLVSSSRPIRMIANERLVSGWWIRGLARMMNVIPLKPGSKASVRRAIRQARWALRRGELVCIFPEGRITRTGELQPFQRGLLAVVRGTGAPLVPVFLDELWGSIFSFHGGRFFWKRPKRWPYPVSIYFGPAMQEAEIDQVRDAVVRLGQQATEKRMSQKYIPPRAFLRNCRENSSKLKVVDTTGEKLTGGQLLLRTLILRRLLLREILAEDEKYVGVLIPPSAGGVIVNAVMPLIGRIGVNLNYTLAQNEMDHCINECGIQHVLTSRRVVENLQKKGLALPTAAELVYLDDLRGKLRLSDKLAGVFMAKLMPLGMLERKLGVDQIQPDDVLSVIFTSGSTNLPKGVMLTHNNVGSNVAAIDELIHLRDDDVLAGTLPLFHSMGYTATMWTVLMLSPTGAYHVSPLDYKIVGRLCRETGATLLITTPTFLRGYLRRCEKQDFAKLNVVVAGAEQLPVPLCDAFEEKFGVRPVEGYGATELSPLVSANIPPERSSGVENRLKEGSVGRPVPGVEARVVHLDTKEPLGHDAEGMLQVRGPNVMKGYLNKPDQTKEVITPDGWYVTGDVARIDEEGFIHITGRVSRFSKIGGEMVPHIKVEDEIHRLVSGDDEQLCVAVTAVPDERKGERLIVLHTQLDKNPNEIRQALTAAGLPNLFIPAAESFYQVEEIPVLGTGKLDLKRAKEMARERADMP